MELNTSVRPNCPVPMLLDSRADGPTLVLAKVVGRLTRCRLLAKSQVPGIKFETDHILGLCMFTKTPKGPQNSATTNSEVATYEFVLQFSGQNDGHRLKKLQLKKGDL